VSRPHSAERSEGSLAQAQALPDNALKRSAGKPRMCMSVGASIRHGAAADRTRQCFPRVRSALRGIDPRDPPPNSRSYRRARHVSATATAEYFSRDKCWPSTHLEVPNAGRDPVHAVRIPAHNITRGTQGVNDPDRPPGPHRGPEAGSFTSWVPLLR
jgi:hypothetical protein